MIDPDTPKDPIHPICLLYSATFFNRFESHQVSRTPPPKGRLPSTIYMPKDFRVRGISRLRFANPSVFPKIPGIFPAVAIFMVGQKASDAVTADADSEQC